MRRGLFLTWTRAVCGWGLVPLCCAGCSGGDPMAAPPGSGGASASGGTTAVGGLSPGACPAGTTACGASCVDAASDPTNCGACGVTCAHPSQQCAGGACVCAPGYSDCGAGCVDVTADAANCGACGAACVAPQLCSLGTCSDACAGGLTACDQSCVDLQTNATHCGVCGQACTLGSSCVTGACQCSAGMLSCAGACVDPLTDAQNCGSCGLACPSGSCVAGACQTVTGVGGGSGTGGTAGIGGSDASGGISGSATGGASTVQCAAGLTACGTSCVDLLTDPENCGECSTACPTGTCDAGVCPTVKDCYAPTVLTSSSFTDFEDYDGVTPVTEWGFAFNAPAGTAGTVYAGPYFYDDATGTPTQSMVSGASSSVYALNAANPAATAYGGGVGFWMGCIDATAYEGISLWVRGSTPSGTAFFTLAMEETSAPSEDDPAGGGTCEATATEGDCEAGGVTIPVTDTWTQLQIPWASFQGGTAAGGVPVPVDGHNLSGMNFNIGLNYVPADPNDPEGEYVPEPGAYELQLDDIAFIEPGACAAGEEMCGVGCVDYQTDSENCGSCGNACDAARACVGGQCQCPTGYSDCDGECVDLQIDAQNCGSCGAACTGPCSGGSCQASTCSAGAAHQDETCVDGGMIPLGKYWVNNNQWGADGASGTLCVWDTCSSGNTIGWGTSWNWSGGAANQVKSYASVVLGWHWGWQNTNTGLPVQLSANRDVTCGWTYAVDATGTFNITYDLFASPSADPGSGDPSDEIMILLRDVDGSTGGLGSLVSQQQVSVAATNWWLYRGSNGYWNVFQYIRASNSNTGATFNLMDFMNDLVDRGQISSSKYLVSVQAGTEVFAGSGQLDTTSYYCTIN